MRTIWKFGPFWRGSNSVYIDDKAKILHVGLQEDSIYAWAEVDTTKAGTYTQFYLAATGGDLPDDSYSYIGTVQNNGIVYHVYVEKRK